MLLWLALVLFCAAGVPLVGMLCVCLYIALYRSAAGARGQGLARSAAVVVLGDIGRSPRMCYHVESLANDGWRVAVVGYPGVALPSALQRSSIRHHHLRTPPSWIAKLPRHAFVLVAPFKLALQAVSLFWELGVRIHPPPQIVLVQTPPALPTLLVVQLVSMLISAKVVIDWHNLAYTILALRLGATSRLVRLAAYLERVSGRKAYAHLFVTEAMKSHLDFQWHLQGIRRVLHDRPPAHFRRATLAESHDLFARLVPSLDLDTGFVPDYALPTSTPWTQQDLDQKQTQWRSDRPALVVSSTSWTADEDFELLLQAAQHYERRAQQGLAALPKLLIVVTGKGELKAHYVAKIASLERKEQWRHVRIRTAWLETQDYPVLLGSADIGVSLHTSSSGLDLPMKVVDMLGCGLPVCALDFACLDELIQDKSNGLVFRTAHELEAQWESLLAHHPEPSWLSVAPGMLRPFERLTSGSCTPTAPPMSPNPSLTLLNSPLWGPAAFATFPRSNWAGNWKAVVRPLLDPDYVPSLEPHTSASERESLLVTDFDPPAEQHRMLRMRKNSSAAQSIPHIHVSHQI